MVYLISVILLFLLGDLINAPSEYFIAVGVIGILLAIFRFIFEADDLGDD